MLRNTTQIRAIEVYTYIHTYMRACMHTYIHVHSYIHSYIHIYIRTNIMFIHTKFHNTLYEKFNSIWYIGIFYNDVYQFSNVLTLRNQLVK